MIHPWLQTDWQALLALGERVPHALLLTGQAGLGKRALAEAFAARLLCASPRADGMACEACAPCRLRLVGTHPDLLHLVPGGLAQVGAGEDGDSELGPTSGGSAFILIEQMRDLLARLEMTAHQGARRVVVVDPAEAMQAVAANALLKVLEEPSPGVVFLLVASSPRQVLPTIRSRCRLWPVSRPASDDTATGEAAALLALCGGAPLAARRLAEQGGDALLARFVKDVNSLGTLDPLVLAEQWGAWLKSREALAAGFALPQLVDWLQRWLSDLLRVRLGGDPHFFPGCGAEMQRRVRACAPVRLADGYASLLEMRRAARHPLNAQSFLEDLLLRYARAVT